MDNCTIGNYTMAIQITTSNNMTTRARQFLTLLLLTVILAACGGGGGDTNPAPPPATTPPVAAPPATPPVPEPPLAHPIPAGLWSPPSGATPSSGNYVYLQSSSGDYVGGGQTLTFTNADSLIDISSTGMLISASVLAGKQYWNGYFRLPLPAGVLQAGYFEDLSPYDSASATEGELNWGGQSRGCSGIKGWFAIDKLVLKEGAIEAIDVRFEQSCDGVNLFHGKIHWNKADINLGKVTAPLPVPAGLWRAPAGSVSSTRTSMYLDIGGGYIYSYDQSNAGFRLFNRDGRLNVNIDGDQKWTGEFVGMHGLPQLTVGYYGNLSHAGFHNPVFSAMSWDGDGNACFALTGWFVIDKVIYSGDKMTELDLRFEQHCEGARVPIHGQLHWRADDATVAPGPRNPPPASLWKPDPAFVAPSGNYVYLVSDAGDYIGQGKTELLTSANSTIKITNYPPAGLRIDVGAWAGEFAGMNSLSQLQPGYYGDVLVYGYHNETKGGMVWYGNARICNALIGWFVVDSVSYSQGELSALDIRFEQHCEGGIAAQRGVIHWVK
jgi:hypothetical protein